jgi:hypothetical protein
MDAATSCFLFYSSKDINLNLKNGIYIPEMQRPFEW